MILELIKGEPTEIIYFILKRLAREDFAKDLEGY